MYYRTIAVLLLFAGQIHADEGIKVRVVGVDNKPLVKSLNAIIKGLEKDLKGKSLAIAKRSAQRYAPVMVRLLKSEAFIAARIEVVPLPDENAIEYRINPGRRFLINSVEFIPVGTPDLPEVNLASLTKGEPARAGAILGGSEAVLMLLRRNGYPYPEVEKPEVTADHARHIVDIRFRVKPGARARFGAIEITGLTTLRPYTIHRHVPWYQGQLYDVRLTELLRTNLVASGLFSTASVTAAPAVSANGELPIRVNAVEREHRTIRLGITYKTDEELGAGVSWENRNLRGHGDRLRVATRVTGFGETGDMGYRRPGFKRRNQSLLLGLKAGHEDPDAFESTNIQLSAALQRELWKHVTVTGGVAFRAEEIEQRRQKDSFGLFSLPARYVWNTSNDILDATRGAKIDISAEPFADTFGSGVAFFKNQNEVSYYLPLTKQERFVIASRVGLGFLVGAERKSIPADLRYYAGGGGSIRGYQYQSVGPIENNEPTGGRSLLDGSLELRTRVSKSIGAVLFADGGSVFENVVPDSNGKVRFSMGVGLRYFTGIGPFRIDFGVPLNRRDSDDNFQVYVSLGQSF